MPMSDQAAKAAEKFLEKLGVNVWKHVRVTDYDGYTVKTTTDLTFEILYTYMAAGVKDAVIKGLDANEFGHTR